MVRWVALCVLSLALTAPAVAGDEKPDPEVERWFEILATPKEAQPFQALNELIALGTKSIPAARAVMNDETQSVVRRWQAAKILGAVGAVEAVQDLLRWIGNDQPVVLSSVAAEAVGRIGDKSALPELAKRWVESANPETKDALGKAIRALGGTVSEATPVPKAPPGLPEWAYVCASEHGKGPRLVFERDDGGTDERAVAADTMLISYIPKGAFGRMPKISVDESDRNRILLRFDLSGLETVTSAHMVLTTETSRLPLTKDLEIGVFAVTEDWNDTRVSWDSQPEYVDAPVATFTITAKHGEVRADVVDAVRAGAQAGAKHHGWLLRVKEPRAPSAVRRPPQPPGRGLVNDLLALVEWAETPEAAVRRAAEEDKLALGLARASFSAEAQNFNEEVFLATVLADPRVYERVREHFVPVRLWYRGWNYTLGKINGPDPLSAFGTSAAETKPLALVVADSRGNHIATLEGIGTFDAGMVEEFLLGALKKAGTKGTERRDEGSDDAGHYWQGVEYLRGGNREDAEEEWKQIGADGAWRLRVRAWGQWPKRMAMYERGAPPEFDEGLRTTSTELRIPSKRARQTALQAVSYLLETQEADGSWPTAQPYAANIPGVTALVARALLMWSGELHPQEKAAAKRSIDRAVEWCEAYRKRTDAAAANSFGTAYMLDFYVDVFERDPDFKLEAQTMVAYHLGGQTPNGAWSYDRNFALRWKGGFGGWPVTDKGRVHSMNTATSVLPLVRAKRLGLSVPQEALEKAKEALLAMRDEPAVWTYTYPEPRNFNKADTSIGRAPACEHALLELGGAKPEDLALAIEHFMTYRDDLRKVAKVTAGWSPPRAVSSYFYFYAYHHAARAIETMPRPKRDELLETLREDILGCVEIDGTWVDYIGVGKPYGTAMALMLLKQAPEASGDR